MKTVSEIWEFEKSINPVRYMRENPGVSFDEAIQERNRKICEFCTAEEYAISELAKCDINVDLALIVYSVKSAFPSVKGKQITAWALANAEKHHEIFAPNAWIKGGKLEIPD